MLQERQAGDLMGGSQRPGLSWWKWMIVHAIGHKRMHPGDHLWMQAHPLLGYRGEHEADAFAGTLLMDGREALEHDRVHLGTLPSTRRLRGMGDLHGPCDRTTGSAEVCSLPTPPPPTDLSLPTMSFGISLYEAQASMNGNMNSLLRHPLTRLHCLLIVLAALAVAVLADGVVSAAPRQQTPPSNDATLSSLSLSDVDLDPAFASGTE